MKIKGLGSLSRVSKEDFGSGKRNKLYGACNFINFIGKNRIFKGFG